MTVKNQNPAMLFSTIAQQVGALSLLAGLYRLAFPSNNQKKGQKPSPQNQARKMGAAGFFLTGYSLFVGAGLINNLFKPRNNISTSTSKPKSP